MTMNENHKDLISEKSKAVIVSDLVSCKVSFVQQNNTTDLSRL